MAVVLEPEDVEVELVARRQILIGELSETLGLEALVSAVGRLIAGDKVVEIGARQGPLALRRPFCRGPASRARVGVSISRRTFQAREGSPSVPSLNPWRFGLLAFQDRFAQVFEQ